LVSFRIQGFQEGQPWRQKRARGSPAALKLALRKTMGLLLKM
jgi:hypothetical protein